jgi:hypothetical protein
MDKRFRSPFPALNVHRRNEAVATDTIEANVAAIDTALGGSNSTISEHFRASHTFGQTLMLSGKELLMHHRLQSKKD